MPPRRRKKKKDVEEDLRSPARIEFENLWISYDILHERLAAKVKRDRLGFDASMFAIFLFVFVVFMASFDYVTAWREATSHAIHETLAVPTFQSSDLDLKTPNNNANATTAAAAATTTVKEDQIFPHLINFNGIKSVKDYNTWLMDVVVENIYVEPVYDSRTGLKKSNQFHGQQSLLWSIAIRQHRVRTDRGGCCLPPAMVGQVRCHPSYGSHGSSDLNINGDVVETRGHGQWVYSSQECLDHVQKKDINVTHPNYDECKLYQWEYKTGKELQDQEFSNDFLSTGAMASYDQGGYRVLFPKNATEARRVMTEVLGQQQESSSSSLSSSSCIINGSKCLGTPVPFIDEMTRMVVVTIQT